MTGCRRVPPTGRSGAVSGSPNAGVCPIGGPDERAINDLETDLVEHLLEEPAVRTELASDVLSEFTRREANSGVRYRSVHPRFDLLVHLRRVEIEDQIADPGDPTRPEHRRQSHVVRPEGAPVV